MRETILAVKFPAVLGNGRKGGRDAVSAFVKYSQQVNEHLHPQFQLEVVRSLEI